MMFTRLPVMKTVAVWMLAFVTLVGMTPRIGCVCADGTVYAVCPKLISPGAHEPAKTSCCGHCSRSTQHDDCSSDVMPVAAHCDDGPVCNCTTIQAEALLSSTTLGIVQSLEVPAALPHEDIVRIPMIGQKGSFRRLDAGAGPPLDLIVLYQHWII